MYGGALLILWVNYWSAAHFIKYNFIRGLGGMIAVGLTCGLEGYYLHLLTSDALKYSPILYLSIGSILINLMVCIYMIYCRITGSRIQKIEINENDEIIEIVQHHDNLEYEENLEIVETNEKYDPHQKIPINNPNEIQQ